MAPSEMARDNRTVLHFSIIRWIADNFCLCEGCTIPRWLLYELYMESCSPEPKYRVNSATFGKLIRLVFPGLRTRRLGKRRNARYHYAGIAVRENSSIYARYCFLLSEKDYHRHSFSEEASSSAWQPSTSAGTSGNACSSGDTSGYKSKSQEKRTVVLLANEYHSHCQDILHTVRKGELDKVEDCIMSFWRSLQPESIALMSSPDVCRLFKSYDRQLFKEMENILLHDFMEEVPMQHIMSVKLFSKNVEDWLHNALAGFPLLVQTSKSEEVTVFIKRLRRKTDLSNVAKAMRTILKSNSNVFVLRSSLHAVINKGFLDLPGYFFQTMFRNPEELQSYIELKCFNDLMSLLAPSTDIRIILNCLSSNLQAFVIQPSRSKEEFRKLASNFQLRWNFLLSAVSKAMTLNCVDGFGCWHVLNLLLMDFVAHIFLSYIEEEEDENFQITKQNESPVLWVYDPRHIWHYFVEGHAQTNTSQTAVISLMQSQNLHRSFRFLKCCLSKSGDVLLILEERIPKIDTKIFESARKHRFLKKWADTFLFVMNGESPQTTSLT